MDPEGVLELFYAECGAAPDYRFRPAIESLPFRCRYKESYFFGVHLPLTRPLPKRIDTSLQQYVGLHAYDAVVLADIDPVVFDADDLHNLLAYVEAGGGLMLIAGPHSFSAGNRNWGPLREALPGLIQLRNPRGPDPCDIKGPGEMAEVTLGDDHAMTTGLTGNLGQVSMVEPVLASCDATVLLRAN